MYIRDAAVHCENARALVLGVVSGEVTTSGARREGGGGVVGTYKPFVPVHSVCVLISNDRSTCTECCLLALTMWLPCAPFRYDAPRT